MKPLCPALRGFELRQIEHAYDLGRGCDRIRPTQVLPEITVFLRLGLVGLTLKQPVQRFVDRVQHRRRSRLVLEGAQDLQLAALLLAEQDDPLVLGAPDGLETGQQLRPLRIRLVDLAEQNPDGGAQRRAQLLDPGLGARPFLFEASDEFRLHALVPGPALVERGGLRAIDALRAARRATGADAIGLEVLDRLRERRTRFRIQFNGPLVDLVQAVAEIFVAGFGVDECRVAHLVDQLLRLALRRAGGGRACLAGEERQQRQCLDHRGPFSEGIPGLKALADVGPAGRGLQVVGEDLVGQDLDGRIGWQVARDQHPPEAEMPVRLDMEVGRRRGDGDAGVATGRGQQRG